MISLFPAIGARLRRRAVLVGLSAAFAGLAAMPSLAEDARTVTHALGETTIPAAPKRVVVLSDFIDLDYVLALGVTPVAYGFTGAWGRGGLPWQTAVADVPHLELAENRPVPERVVAFEPDLIIGMKSYIEPLREQLESIAPVVALDWSTSWRDGIRTIGQALFMDEEAEAAIAETEAYIAEMAVRLDGLGGKTIRIGSLYGDTLYVIGAGPIADRFAELGLTFLPAPDAEPGGLASYSMENVDILSDADILISFATNPESTAVLEAFPPFQRLKSVAAGAYIPLDSVMASGFADNFSPLNDDWVLPRLAELLEAAAAKL